MTKIRTGNPDRTRAGSFRTLPERAVTAADTTEAFSETITPSLEAQESTLEGIEHQLIMLVDRVMKSLYPATSGALRIDISSSNATVNSNITNVSAIGGLTPTAFMPNMQQQVFYTLRANIVTT